MSLIDGIYLKWIWLSVVVSILAFPGRILPADDLIVDSGIVKTEQTTAFINPLSVRPLYLIGLKGKQVLGRATGFVVQKVKDYYLITNWHVVSGRDPRSDEILDQKGRTISGTMGSILDTGFERKRAFMIKRKQSDGLNMPTVRLSMLLRFPCK